MIIINMANYPLSEVNVICFTNIPTGHLFREARRNRYRRQTNTTRTTTTDLHRSLTGQIQILSNIHRNTTNTHRTRQTLIRFNVSLHIHRSSNNLLPSERRSGIVVRCVFNGNIRSFPWQKSHGCG